MRRVREPAPEVADYVARRTEALRIGVSDLDVERRLDSHYELHDIQPHTASAICVA